MRVHSWRSKLTNKWVIGTPYNYDAADRIRARYEIQGGPNDGKEKFVEIKRWPDKPGLTAVEQTDFIEGKLHVYFDPYRLSGS